MDSAPRTELGIISNFVRLGEGHLSRTFYLGQSETTTTPTRRRWITCAKVAGILLAAGILGSAAVLGGLYRSHQRDAARAALDTRCRILEADQKILVEQALPVDPQFELQAAELGRQRQAAEYLLGTLVVEKQHLARETLRDRLTREDAIHGLRLQIDKTQDELKVAGNALQLAQGTYRRAHLLQPKGAVSEAERLESLGRVKSYEIEVAKLEGQLRNLDRQKAALERGLQLAAAESETHRQSLDAELARLEKQLAETAAGQKGLAAARAEDRLRAARHRHAAVGKLAGELDQLAAQRAGLADAADHAVSGRLEEGRSFFAAQIFTPGVILAGLSGLGMVLVARSRRCRAVRDKPLPIASRSRAERGAAAGVVWGSEELACVGCAGLADRS